ncbi:pentapeptide repeat-containing protein [Jiangella muralis]|uniref:pentapeptide repeat-containing protein n=1 Tax=Jiangella muralis TaxID=702383 RepID=UPI00069F58AD|nr:pentapeptide repeat-containing protein [Jiangella muralis]
MTVAAVILLAVAAVAGAVVWYSVEHRRPEAGTGTWLAAAAVPIVLAGAAALFGLGGDPAGEGLLGLTRAAAVVAAVTGGSVIATALLRVADRRTADFGPSGTTSANTGSANFGSANIGSANIGSAAEDGPGSDGVGGDATAAVSDPETLRGGTSIGALERVAVAVTLLAGWPEGLALVLGVKGLGRYPELRRPAAAERFIIGTLASVLWAVATVGVVVAVQT